MRKTVLFNLVVLQENTLVRSILCLIDVNTIVYIISHET